MQLTNQRYLRNTPIFQSTEEKLNSIHEKTLIAESLPVMNLAERLRLHENNESPYFREKQNPKINDK